MPDGETAALPFEIYAARQRSVIDLAPGVWQHTPIRDEHLAVMTAEHDRMASEGADPATPKLGYPLADHGGSTIASPKLFIIYLGPWWGNKAKLEGFANDLMAAGYLAPLAVYGSGVGTFMGSFQTDPVSGTVTDGQLQTILSNTITAKEVPAPDGHTLYALLLPQGVSVTQGGSASCSSFCGYHGALPDGKTFYAVQPATDCQGCNEGDAFIGFTAVLAHEVAEACTDAVPGKGWFNDTTGMENADEWAWVFGPYGPWTVQGYQLNGVGNSLGVIRYQQPVPVPQPKPKPQPACRAQVDAEFAVLLSAIGTGNDKWSQAGRIWIGWAQQEMDKVVPV